MYQTFSLKEKLKLFSIILFPILITQISLNLMTFFNTVMSGQSGAVDLAGVAIGASIWSPIFTSVTGILLALTPIIAQLIGANKYDDIPKQVQQGIYVSIFISIIVIIAILLLVNPILNLLSLEPEVLYIAKYYLLAICIGIMPLFIFTTLRNFMNALGKTNVSMFIILISLPINVLLNYLLIFGKFGFPALGGIGSGIATSLTYWLVCIITIVIIYKSEIFRPYHIFKSWSKPLFSYWWEQLKVGVPIGISIFFESSIFAAVTLFISVYSTYTIAAHQAAMNFVSLLYMIPLSVGMALTIAVGYEVGARRFSHARTFGYIGISSGFIIAIFVGLILFIFDDEIARMYSSNPQVIDLTKQFIIYAIIFQIADAFGPPIQGSLRGYKDVNITLYIALISYWIIGLPSGWLLAKYTALEPFGYWVGLIIGLTIGSIALLIRLLYVQRQYATGSKLMRL
ncbi:MATE family efflux transporter [Ornithinibacillus sp. 4-3]|uniref:Probable multidrug resistance protein NorM n=1 Tax=Ornithinibacillus sp. 4-3 TaxID=3231488 RepID=A0AB39HN76_9BACI